jgi:hypothetical protein
VNRKRDKIVLEEICERRATEESTYASRFANSKSIVVSYLNSACKLLTLSYAVVASDRFALILND